jgi:hypothetical protein
MESKRIFLITLFLFIIGLAVLGYSRAVPGVENQTGNYPRIEITPGSFDFGEVKYGQIAEYTFKVKNSGSKILEIKKVATSCACTSAEIEKEIIEPNEEIGLRVTYNTGLMSGSHAKGEQERIIYVKTNDPINPQVEVTISAYVE